MNRAVFVLFLSVVALLVGSSPAQVGPNRVGLLVQGTSGTAGSFCFDFDCTPRQMTASAGETLTLTTRAPMGNFYGIGFSARATGCAVVPGVANMLILDPPVFTLVLGTINVPDPILACWGGLQTNALPLPVNLPPGLSFATQAVAVVPGFSGPSNPAFSVAVVTVIR